MSPDSQSTTTTTERPTSLSGKSKRLLACIECQKRKTKCDHQSPCGHCTRLKLPCRPASQQTRRRRRKYSEKVLLERLRHYEALLRQSKISFQPFNLQAAEADAQSLCGERGEDEPLRSEDGKGSKQGAANGADELFSPPTDESMDAVNLWTARCRNPKPEQEDVEDGEGLGGRSEYVRKDDITHLPTLQNALDQIYHGQDTKLLFCEPTLQLDLTSLHPPHNRIFLLWQTYMDDVDPLLKITHNPTIQARLIDAMGNMASIGPTMHALMFSIYSVAVRSLSDEECLTKCGAPKKEVLSAYQLGCQQAIWRCNFLRSNDRDTLTAVLLYLISIKPDVDHRSLSTLLGTVIRIAQRIGIDSEARNSECDAFEGEMRRRLWWALVLFDRRVCETSHNLRLSALTPTWSCKLPANVNDFELRPGMQSAPQAHDRPTESFHIIIRCAIAQRLRYSPSQMDFVNPMLRSLARGIPNGLAEGGDDLTVLGNLIAPKSSCEFNLEDPLQFVTVWSARCEFAEARLWKHYWTIANSAERPSDAHRDAAMSHALAVIECEASLSISPLAKKFRWYVSHFPFAAYIHVIQELKARPHQPLSRRAWAALNHDFMTRFKGVSLQGHPIFTLLAKAFVQGWEARGSEPPGHENVTEPPVVAEMRHIAEPVDEIPRGALEPPSSSAEILGGLGLQDFLPVPADFGGYDIGNLESTWPDFNGTGSSFVDMDWLGIVPHDAGRNPSRGPL